MLLARPGRGPHGRSARPSFGQMAPRITASCSMVSGGGTQKPALEPLRRSVRLDMATSEVRRGTRQEHCEVGDGAGRTPAIQIAVEHVLFEGTHTDIRWARDPADAAGIPADDVARL